MLSFTLLLMLGVATADTETGSLPELVGIVQGVVVDGTKENKPLEGVEVILRAGTDGDLVPVAETRTDRYGKFAFKQVPPDPTIVYLPGANREGVHYPGQRVRLDANSRVAHVTIVVFAAVATPRPLMAKRHDFDVEVEEQALKITETLWLSNPTRATYVGQSMGNEPPVTFWLSIPKNFDRVTFDKEFFGRRFLVVDHRPVTDIPWLPGEHELRFTYHVPLIESEGHFHRPLDVPSSKVRVRVRGTSGDQVSCNLPRAPAAAGEMAFASAGGRLPEMFALEFEIGALPFPWMQYARWGALAALVAFVTTTLAIYRHRGCRSDAQPEKKDRPPGSRQRAA
jgi:hypothetical protein